MSDEYLVPPKQAPALNIPASDMTVKVSVIDSTTRLKLGMSKFLQPDYVGHPDLLGPSFSFLVEHPSRRPILFDLGVRKDFEKLPSYKKFPELEWKVSVAKAVATILKEHHVDVDGGAIESIIWSHHHWDHRELVVGPGFKKAYLPGYPVRKEATLLQSDFEGREVREKDFEKQGKGLKIGRFNAFDYFGDGSFYLLDTPGHSIGHMCGLARTSTRPDTFIFMGGDASHHGGEFRPTKYLPLPKEIKPAPFQRRHVCPGELLQSINPHNAPDKHLYYVTRSFADDKETADWTIDGLTEFDAHENVLLMLAHDDAVVDPPEFDMYPRSINDWYEKGIAKKVKWLFVRDFEEAVESKEKGGEAFRWGEYP